MNESIDKSPIRVLQINAGSDNFGGVSSFLFNIYKELNHSEIQFDFLSPYKTTYAIVEKDINSMGGRTFELCVNGQFLLRTLRLYFKVRKFLQKNKYSIVHINSGSIFFNYIVSLAANHVSVPTIIVHSHNGADEKDNWFRRFIFERLKVRIEKNADYLFACSEAASNFMFSEKARKDHQVRIIHNGIDLEKFKFDNSRRIQLRRERGFEEKIIIGNIGRLVRQKNQSFLIEVFSKLHDIDPNYFLLLYGEGDLEKQLYKEIAHHNLQDCVKISSLTRDIQDAYLMMDAFILTSLYEGLPVTGVEAQANGLCCFFSDTITREIKINENVWFFSLHEPAEKWAHDISDIVKNNGERIAQNNSKIYDYDIKHIAAELTEFYQKSVKNRREDGF